MAVLTGVCTSRQNFAALQELQAAEAAKAEAQQAADAQAQQQADALRLKEVHPAYTVLCSAAL